ncbi:MAG: bifunctional diaminohydroxyphosphoribosylaminopyrimidine deaminase/5-amino-6-(5-phosphoribosylamino)uracil reductase RibD [Paludibacteraceae bacterium]|nr:bifunctional diaminohydroxyphosphoribosylaminopyrimidine deaminase/5-amino-6-(5-phosphoribosylamino)uracil reductase RibD [Paludibacteraceae bacterium]
MLDYARYIERTLQLARLGEYYVAPNPMVGAVLADADGKIIGEGWHRQYGGPHAEVECLGDMVNRGYGESGNRLKDCTLFVNLEPCSHYGKTPPCAKMIIEKGIGKVVVGMLDPNPLVAGNGVKMLREAGVEVTVGVMEEACRELNRRFLCLHEKKRPYIILKWAQTKDGYLDREDGSRAAYGLEDAPKALQRGPLVISTPLTKQIVHKMRAENMAILVGSGTAIKDNPKLTTTRWTGRNPIRVLLDRRGRVPMDSRIFSDEAETIVYRENTDWQYVLADLASRGIHSVLVEGGATVLNSILTDGTWDEIHVEVSDVSLNAEGVPAPQLPLPNCPTQTIDNHLMYEIRKNR